MSRAARPHLVSLPSSTYEPIRRHDTTPIHDPAEDQAFCVGLLPKVSRTFALSITAMPETLRDTVRIAYLLCRIVDTVEDEADMDPNDRTEMFDRFDALMADDREPPEPFEQRTDELSMGLGSNDFELCKGAGAVFRQFRALPWAHKNACRPHIQEMSRGMRAYTARADAVGKLRLRDLDELEHYCHFVAGTVGKLLTALFELEVPDLDPHTRRALRGRAISFGLALQLVNIVKDVAKDFPRGDCFLPMDLARAQGIELDALMEPENRDAGLAVIRAVCARARQHLRRAEEYTALWPMPAGEQVRLFCTVPLALALATLKEVEEGADTLVEGKCPKVSRDTVMSVFRDAKVAIQRDDTLTWMLRYHATA